MPVCGSTGDALVFIEKASTRYVVTTDIAVNEDSFLQLDFAASCSVTDSCYGKYSTSRGTEAWVPVTVGAIQNLCHGVKKMSQESAYWASMGIWGQLPSTHIKGQAWLHIPVILGRKAKTGRSQELTGQPVWLISELQAQWQSPSQKVSWRTVSTSSLHTLTHTHVYEYTHTIKYPSDSVKNTNDHRTF